MQRKDIHSIEVIQFMTHSSLKLYKKVGSKAPLHKRTKYEQSLKGEDKKGIVFVSSSKEELTNGVGHIVTSYETLYQQKNSLTHWTPNTFRGGSYYDFKNRVIKGHTRDNLKQINVIGFDIDTKEIDLYALFLGCDELGLPRPNVLLETPKGFQGFFVLETPFYINKNNDFKALRVAEQVASNVLESLKKYVPVDTNCTPFGFYRIPNDFNLIYFDDKPANTSLLISWSKQYEEEKRRSTFKVVFANGTGTCQTSTEWYSALLNNKEIQKGFHGSSRNNALFTLAVANFASGISYEDAYDTLDQFNSNLSVPLSVREFERTVKSAYSGRYNAPKRTYVEGLLEMWTDGSVKYQGREGWYKFKKSREERVRSHYQEWEDDISLFLDKHISPEKPFFEGSLRVLSETINIPLSTLKEVLKRSSKLVKKTIGRGRSAITMITTKAMLFRNLLHNRQQYIKQAQLSFSELLPESDVVIHSFDIPYLDEVIITQEIDLIYRGGASPPDKLVV
ncbi:primase C-terminal domain-containing protein [Niallia sp. MER 6]|uniref:primase C-terminal domain-containing protein n=1 Tax=Niallia sp. MER 6 TaxID=2939567 RepID=UPI00203DB65C|nr:primase C-terminal domain-containing protein [Niallia sp. MER 6]MCM3032905.1 primase C-terminal domain-containing protein [Niallia sp. MER 6]